MLMLFNLSKNYFLHVAIIHLDAMYSYSLQRKIVNV